MSGIFDFQQITSLQLRDFVARFISTGNVIVDMVIGVAAFQLVLSITAISQSQFWHPFVEVYTRFFASTKPLHRGQIEYSWMIDPSSDESRTKISTDISPHYKAIMYRIAKIKDDRVKKLRECNLEFYTDEYQADEDGHEYYSYVNKIESFYECIQSEPLEIVEDVFVNISEEEKVHTSKKGGEIRNFQRSLVLYSDRHDPHQLTVIVDEWVKEYEASKKAKVVDQQMIFQVRFDSNGEQHTFASPFHTFRNFENLYFEHKDHVLKELEFFQSQQQWYEARGLPHTLGILCHGEPGCGKTSFIKALLQHTKRHAVVFSINGFTNLEIVEKLMRTERIADYPIPQENRVYVFEDIDAMGDLVKKRRKAGDKSGGLMDEGAVLDALFGKSKKSNTQHLGFLLNLLDGVMESPGRIVVMTTNFINQLDEALIRPGRIDLKLEFGRCRRNDIIQILSLFYDVPKNEIQLPEDVKDLEITPARISQICRGSKRSLQITIKRILEAVLPQSTILSRDPNESPSTTTTPFLSTTPHENDRCCREEWLAPHTDEFIDSLDHRSKCLDCQLRPTRRKLMQKSHSSSSSQKDCDLIVNIHQHHHHLPKSHSSNNGDHEITSKEVAGGVAA